MVKLPPTMTWGDRQKIVDGTAKSYTGVQASIAETEEKQTAAAKNKQATGEATELAPGKIAQQGAELQKTKGEASKAFAEAKAATNKGELDPETVSMIANGHMVPERLSYILARNPKLIDEIAKTDPSFDLQKAQSYGEVYKQFTSTKPGTAGYALNAGGTSLQHLKELRDLNTVASRIPGTKDHQAYENKVDTVSSELAKFYGDATIPAIEHIKKTLNAPFNRDAAITTQAKSMGDKIDNYEQQWINAAPSKSYEAPLPGISAAAKVARAALDPDYAKKAGMGGSGITVTDPRGVVHSFQNQADAAAFKQAAHIQ
jgi:hypothetical protein